MSRRMSRRTSGSTRVTLRVMFGALLVSAVGQACSQYHADDRVTVQTPGSTSFRLVGIMLDRRCGSLDCHGATQRNMRLYGEEGLRLDPGDQPGSSETTNAEILENFHAVVAVEPELFTKVVTEKGAHPERLTLVRKARGLEAHLGGTLFVAGDDEDACFVSWLGGTTNEAICTRAIAALDPLLDVK